MLVLRVAVAGLYEPVIAWLSIVRVLTFALEVVRKPGKLFRQRRPDPSGVGWVWDLRGVRRVPYRLPELLAKWDEALEAKEAEAHPDYPWPIKLAVVVLVVAVPWGLFIVCSNALGVFG